MTAPFSIAATPAAPEPSGRAVALDLDVEETKKILPDAEGIFDALARIGYEFEHAVADLVDNSIDAEATEVLVRFFHDRHSVYAVAVIDNGKGMDGDRIDSAMAFGARTGKTDVDLGKYGLGLKSASFSQCDSLTVVSRHLGAVVGRRWKAENVRQDWLCEIIKPAAAENHLVSLSDRIDTAEHGTLVQWDSLDAMSHAAERPSRTIEARFSQLSTHLGLVFHRFIAPGRFRIRLDAVDPAAGTRGPPQEVRALDPFPRSQAVSGYPMVFSFKHPGVGQLDFEAHIWRRNATEAGFRLGGGRLAKRQGFYIYRNRRLVQPGGWNGLRNDAEVHTSLARVRFDIPPTLDSLFKPTVQKSSVTVPPSLLKSIRGATSGDKTFNDFLADAEQAYRQDNAAQGRHGLVPTSGLTQQLSRKFERILGEPRGHTDEVTFEWRLLPSNEFFRVDAETGAISINSTYRTQVLHGTRASAGDAPVVKTLLMLLCRDDMGRVNRVKKHEEQTRVFNRLLVEAVRSQG